VFVVNPFGLVLSPAMRSRLGAALKPLENGPQEIRALDGLRAVAAISIVVFHALHAANFQASPISRVLGNFFWFLPTGVHLFFVLSGFLLFLPYARAMLTNRPLPHVWLFYKRRALRILPVYWLALVVLAILTALQHAPLRLGQAIVAHLFMVHDVFPHLNRDLEGPLWTLAVEAQFYLLLPLIAAALARFVGHTRSARRLLSGIAIAMALALVIRAADIAITASLPVNTTEGIARAFVLITMGMQGKYLEVFITGMLASVLYVVTVEHGNVSVWVRRRAAWGILLASIIVLLLAVQNVRYGGTIFTPGARWGAQVLFYPLLVGAGYASLLLAILWSNRVIRWLFESPPMRFVGHISYSLYVWHNPIILAIAPFFAGIPILARFIFAFPVAYVSYQLVERPFLRRRHDTKQKRGETTPTPDNAREQPVATRAG
jgi:peptidoglycan/LPS O-acetylase OafA/YrhL